MAVSNAAYAQCLRDIETTRQHGVRNLEEIKRLETALSQARRSAEYHAGILAQLMERLSWQAPLEAPREN